MQSDKQSIRNYYDNCSEYESFLEQRGWITPQILAYYISRHLKGNERVVDVGCGPGLVGQALNRIGWRGQLLGVDFARKRLLEAKQKRIYKFCFVADANRLPFGNCSFDAVISNAMVGLTGNKSVREMARLVKPGGYFGCVAGEVKIIPWCRVRFRRALRYLRNLPGMEILLERDLRTGYADSDYNHEHYVLFIFRKKSQ